MRKKLRRLGEKLPHKPVLKFYQKSELIGLMNRCDLYVHASDVEIEAISCIEAFSCGLVPVIADSRKSATPQFALDERSLLRPAAPLLWLKNRLLDRASGGAPSHVGQVCAAG